MPNIKSAIKRVSVIETKTLRNNMIKSEYKTAVKKFETAVAENRWCLLKRNYKKEYSIKKKIKPSKKIKYHVRNKKDFKFLKSFLLFY